MRARDGPGLLISDSAPPFKGDEIKVVRTFSSPSATNSPIPSATPTKRDNAAGSVGIDMRWIVLTSLSGTFLSALV